jgi:pimeloyl-ACP methyl ester carboxylesterase
MAPNNSKGGIMIRKTLSLVFIVSLVLSASASGAQAAFNPTSKPVVKSIELSNKLKFSYAEQGSASGIPVIFLHGYTDSWRSFELVLPHLPQSVHAFALSQRGHGDSDRPQENYRPQDFSADVAAFMDALKLKRAVIVGHSMGSYIAQKFAMDYDRTMGLVLIGSFTTVRGNEEVKKLWDSVVSKLADPVDPEFVRGFQQSTLNKPVTQEFLDTVVQESLKAPARVWQAALKGLMESDISGELDKIKSRTLIIWGDKDSFFPRSEQDALAQAITGSQLVVYSGVGHGLHWEDPKRFADDLTAFVDKLVRSKTAMR